MQRCGLAGERKYAKLLYLILNTRFLSRPVSAVIKGPSSGGKSKLLETVLRFVPDRAFEAFSGLSEKVLPRMGEKLLKQKFLVIYEAAGLQKADGRAMLRTLLSEGQIRYMTNVPTKDGWEPKEYVLEGPTGLLMTTTETDLHAEDESRMLSISVDDSPEQIKRVLLKMTEVSDVTANLDPWHSFHAWLEGGAKEVVVPFERTLANLIRPVHNRIKRDFGHVQTLIRTHALIHQLNRTRDNQGRIVAELSDYGAVRDLVAEIVSAGAEASVTPKLQETIKAVAKINAQSPASIALDVVSTNDRADLSGVPLWRIAKELRLDKSSASRRVDEAETRGYLINLEPRKGRPAKLVLGEPLPADRNVFPTVQELETALAAVDAA